MKTWTFNSIVQKWGEGAEFKSPLVIVLEVDNIVLVCCYRRIRDKEGGTLQSILLFYEIVKEDDWCLLVSSSLYFFSKTLKMTRQRSSVSKPTELFRCEYPKKETRSSQPPLEIFVFYLLNMYLPPSTHRRHPVLTSSPSTVIKPTVLNFVLRDNSVPRDI